MTRPDPSTGRRSTTMARDDSRPPRDPERKRDGPSSEGARGSAQRAVAWSRRRGHSGYGLESIRPHLRAQIEHQKLWRPTFPPEEGDINDEDD